MSLIQTTTGAINQILAFDGTAALKDAIHNVAFQTSGGTPTTAALLGSTAPKIGAAWYLNWYYDTAMMGLTAGMAFSAMFVVNTAWAGNDGLFHVFFDNGAAAATNRIRINTEPSQIEICVWDSTSTIKMKYAALDAANWAAGTHVVIATRSATGTLGLYLDGTTLTSSFGAGSGLESTVSALSFFGTNYVGAQSVEGAVLSAIWGRVLTAGEITALSAPANWASVIDYPQLTVTGLSPGNAVALYDSAGNLHANAVESGGTATLSYQLD